MERKVLASATSKESVVTVALKAASMARAEKEGRSG
jgi:hypothetical protein